MMAARSYPTTFDSTTITAPLGVQRYPALAALAPVRPPAGGGAAEDDAEPPRRARARTRPTRLHVAPDVVALALFAVLVGADLAVPLSAGAMLYLIPIAVLGWRRGRVAAITLAVIALIPGVVGGVDLAMLAARAVVQLTVGITAAQGRYAVRAMIERDELTDLYNRRGLTRIAAAEIVRARRTRRPLSVAFLDLDDFKRINDRHGHAAGDRALAALGRALGNGRRRDAAARFGGDEFVLIMPDRDRVEARHALERLASLARAELQRAGFDVGFTAGLVTFARPPADVDALLRPADDLLTHGKAHRKGAVWSMDAHATAG
jgi:diguanylate cyclase (GGDEF)-like protein